MNTENKSDKNLVRLNKLIAERGLASRRGADKLIADGQVTVNGTPVSWGSVIFTPEDPSAPVACARVMRGSFKLDEKTGPVTGKVKLTLSYSAADVPNLETADGTVTTKEQKPGAGEWSFEVVEGAKNVELAVTR